VARERQATAYWNDRYRGQGVALPADTEPCAREALAHFGDVRGKRLLDLGCGPGDYSLFFAERGADVTAIDYSDVAIDQLQTVCRNGGIDNVHPVVADAFDIERLGPFDLVFGKWILHHLEPFSDFARTLRNAVVDDGRGFFYENNGLSGVLLWARAHLAGKYGIPKFGDDEEFPLTPDEIEELRAYFDVEVDVAETYLAQLGAQYLLRSHLMGLAAKTDGVVHERLPRLRRYSYRQNLLLRARAAR
jgi:2-polyprenyl-3-methyl-5-hydroxy-6-metoxy-1,4-benzoquinol methylase